MTQPTTSTMTEPTTHTLEAPGAVLTYDVRRNDSSTEPVLSDRRLADGREWLRDAGRSLRRPDGRDLRPARRRAQPEGRPVAESTPDQHADDISRVIAELGVGPVDLFASSGGAVNALALVARHPEQVRMLVAHEPPAAEIVPDREAALAGATRTSTTPTCTSGFGPGMARFIALVSHKGPITADTSSQPAPDPAMFGLPTEDDGSRTDALLAQNMITCTHYKLDFDALREGFDPHRDRRRRRVGG